MWIGTQRGACILILMQVTYLTVDSVTEGVGRSQVVPVVNGLAQRGWHVRLVSCEKNAYLLDQVARELDPEIDFHAVRFGLQGTHGAASRVRHLRKLAFPTDIVHCRSDQPLLAALGRYRRPPVVWDSRSFWAEQKVASGVLSPGSLSFRGANALEGMGARRADAIAALSQAGLDAMAAKWGRTPAITLVSPTLVDTAHFPFQPWSTLSEVEVLFSGTYNAFYDLDLSAAFISRLSSHVEVKTTWASGHEAQESQLAPVKVDHRVVSNYRDLPGHIGASHLGMAVCHLDAGRSLAMAMPTKIGEFLATGRPVVVNKGLGDMDWLIRKYDVGVILHGRDGAHLDHACRETLRLLQDEGTPGRCRALAEDHFDLSTGVDRLDILYHQVLESRVPAGRWGRSS